MIAATMGTPHTIEVKVGKMGDGAFAGQQKPWHILQGRPSRSSHTSRPHS